MNKRIDYNRGFDDGFLYGDRPFESGLAYRAGWEAGFKLRRKTPITNESDRYLFWVEKVLGLAS